MAKYSLDNYPVTLQIPVLWGDMDALNHVNNTKYFRYFESARIEYCNAIGLEIGSEIVGLVISETGCRFRRPITYPDTVSVGARTIEIGQSEFLMEHGIFSQALDDMAAIGTAKVVCIDANGGRVAIPESVRQKLLGIDPQAITDGQLK
ncbi:MAG: acyl-CoA thioesterase [Gammaproteobacteria bacterium]|nr:acyl-CoA thioesterase [Gammaproteobacteria bacterium]